VGNALLRSQNYGDNDDPLKTLFFDGGFNAGGRQIELDQNAYPDDIEKTPYEARNDMIGNSGGNTGQLILNKIAKDRGYIE